jgi:predicted O-methyltransferase YrrM
MNRLAAGSQRTNLINVLRYAASHPRSAFVMLRKLAKRLDGTGRYSPGDNARWIDAHKLLPSDYAAARDPELWREALQFGESLRDRAKPILAGVPFDMGAGGDYEFLYWLTRHLKPMTVVETGVSAGWSSQAFLAAMEKNGSGKLYSSDFPLFRVRDPDQYIGVLVEDSLKHRWELHTEGDEIALPRILNSVRSVDLFHYDSDKSISGRRTAYSLVKPRLKGPMLMDDILNDSWFRELVEEEGLSFTIIMNAAQHCFGMIEP